MKAANLVRITGFFCACELISFNHLYIVYKLLLASPSDWVQLTSLTWHIPVLLESGTLDQCKSRIQDVTSVLQNFRPPELRRVNLVLFQHKSVRELLVESLPSLPELCADLEKTLIMFPQPTIWISSPRCFNSRRHHSWMLMLERLFPVLAKRHALELNGNYCESYCVTTSPGWKRLWVNKLQLLIQQGILAMTTR